MCLGLVRPCWAARVDSADHEGSRQSGSRQAETYRRPASLVAKAARVVGALAPKVLSHFVPMIKQAESNWCWAASISNVLSSFGLTGEQPKVVSRLYGTATNKTVDDPYQINFLMRAFDPNHRLHSYVSENLHSQPDKLLDQLKAGAKVIALAKTDRGHIVVFQGVDDDGKVIVSDPADGKTKPYSVAELYSKWHWHGSIIVESNGAVGAPVAFQPLEATRSAVSY